MKKASLKKLYDQDELKILIDMISEMHNKNRSPGNPTGHYGNFFYHKSIEETLKRLHENNKDFRYYINKGFGKSTAKSLKHFFSVPLEDVPLEDVPLYLNDKNDYIRVFAKFRLRGGR